MLLFEWDVLKHLENKMKHGVSFEEAKKSFDDPFGLILRDERHSTLNESRYYWIGESGDRILTKYFTLRGSTIRIIGSAEWRKFRRLYERAKVKEFKN